VSPATGPVSFLRLRSLPCPSKPLSCKCADPRAIITLSALAARDTFDFNHIDGVPVGHDGLNLVARDNLLGSGVGVTRFDAFGEQIDRLDKAYDTGAGVPDP
jgi:hypothetical protein